MASNLTFAFEVSQLVGGNLGAMDGAMAGAMANPMATVNLIVLFY